MRTMRQDGGSRNKWVATPRCNVGNDARGCGNRDGWWVATPHRCVEIPIVWHQCVVRERRYAPTGARFSKKIITPIAKHANTPAATYASNERAEAT